MVQTINKYKARGLYAMLQSGMKYDDKLICTAYLPPNKNGLNVYEEEDKLLYPDNGFEKFTSNSFFSIYPNPIQVGNRFTNHRIGWLFRSFTGVAGGFGLNISNSTGTAYKDNNNLFNGQYANLTIPASGVNSPAKIVRMTWLGDLIPRYIYFNPSNPNVIAADDSKCNYPLVRYTVDYTTSNVLFNDCTAPLNVANVVLGDGGLSDDEAIDIIEGDNQYPLFNEVGQYVDRTYLYTLLENNMAMMNSESVYGDFYADQSGENLGRIQAVENLMALLSDPAFTEDSIRYDSLFSVITNGIGLITDEGNLYENCAQWMDGQYLIYLEQGLQGLNHDDKVNIALLANSCPAAIGPCVYKARSLYAIIQPGMQYADNILCIAALPPSKNGNNHFNEEEALIYQDSKTNLLSLAGSYFTIYPNPSLAGTNLNVAYDLPDKLQTAELQLYDAVGRLIEKYKIDATLKHSTIQLKNDIASGVYKLRLAQSGKTIEAKKLTIAN